MCWSCVPQNTWIYAYVAEPIPREVGDKWPVSDLTGSAGKPSASGDLPCRAGDYHSGKLVIPDVHNDIYFRQDLAKIICKCQKCKDAYSTRVSEHLSQLHINDEESQKLNAYLEGKPSNEEEKKEIC